jgi:hypothetical protein
VRLDEATRPICHAHVPGDDAHEVHRGRDPSARPL